MIKNARFNYRNTLTWIESTCTFRVAFSSLMITSHELSNQIYFCISLEHQSTSVGLQGPCHVCLGSVYIKKMTIVYIRPHVHVGVRTYSPHNLHHTSHIENNKKHIVGLQSVAFFLFCFQVLVDFTANKHGLDSCLYLQAEVLELFLDIIC